MISSLDELRFKFIDLNSRIKEGKIISTSLTSDVKLSRFQFIVLSIVTFGLYYGFYKYQHDRKRVFIEIKNEINKTMNNYHLKYDSNFLTEYNKKRLESQNSKLEKIKKNLNQNTGNEFTDQILFFQKKHQELENSAKNLYIEVLEKKFSSVDSKKSIFDNLIKNYENKPSLSLEEKIIYDHIKKCTADQIQLYIDYQTKKLHGKLEGLLNKKKEIDVWGSVDLPSITTEEMIEHIDTVIVSNKEKLNPEYNKKMEESFLEKVEKDKKNLEETLDILSDIVSTIWKKSKNSNEQEELFLIKMEFLNKIEKEEKQAIRCRGIDLSMFC